MKRSNNCPPYSLSRERYLLYAQFTISQKLNKNKKKLKSYEFHQNKLQTIYSSQKTHNENPFFEKQLQYQTTKHSQTKPLRSK